VQQMPQSNTETFSNTNNATLDTTEIPNQRMKKSPKVKLDRPTAPKPMLVMHIHSRKPVNLPHVLLSRERVGKHKQTWWSVYRL